MSLPHANGRAVGAAAILLVAGSAANAQVASALIREGDALGGSTVSSVSAVSTNYSQGWAAIVNRADGIATVFGNYAGGAGAIIRTEGTFGPLVQTALEGFFRIGDSSVGYSASGTGGPAGGFDSVWVDDTPIAVEGNPVPSIANQFWTFGSRPGVTANGTPYWVGGYSATQGGTTQNRGLFYGSNATPLLLGGQLVPGLSTALVTSSFPFDYRFSENGSNYISPVTLSGATATNQGVVINGSAAVAGGSSVQKGTVVPIASGGNGAETYENFDFVGINETGDWMVTGDTNAATAGDEFIMKNGSIVLREGQSLAGGGTIGGAIDMGFMNESGDWAVVWDVDTKESLIFNSMRILSVGENMDLTGDGIPEPNSILTDFTGIATLFLSDRTGNYVDIYFTADVDVNGTTSTTDDINAAWRIRVEIPAPGAAGLLGLAGLASLRRRRN